MLGWIAQDVAPVFPKAITFTQEHGFSDFQACYGAQREKLEEEIKLIKDRLAASQ